MKYAVILSVLFLAGCNHMQRQAGESESQYRWRMDYNQRHMMHMSRQLQNLGNFPSNSSSYHVTPMGGGHYNVNRY